LGVRFPLARAAQLGAPGPRARAPPLRRSGWTERVTRSTLARKTQREPITATARPSRFRRSGSEPAAPVRFYVRFFRRLVSSQVGLPGVSRQTSRIGVPMAAPVSSRSLHAGGRRFESCTAHPNLRSQARTRVAPWVTCVTGAADARLVPTPVPTSEEVTRYTALHVQPLASEHPLPSSLELVSADLDERGVPVLRGRSSVMFVSGQKPSDACQGYPRARHERRTNLLDGVSSSAAGPDGIASTKGRPGRQQGKAPRPDPS
jgi:hypothetical protein